MGALRLRCLVPFPINERMNDWRRKRERAGKCCAASCGRAPLPPKTAGIWDLNREGIQLPPAARRFGMGIIATIIIGLVVGAVAKLLMPGRDPGGFIITALIGLAGALLGGFLGRMLGLYQPDQPAGFIASVIGAMILLLLYRVIAKPRA